MTSEKIQVKVFATGPVNAVDYVPAFQRWIREHLLDELLIDVVDYSHVFEGPEVALIGHESDYVLDRAGGRIGLLYANKRGLAGDNNPYRTAVDRAIRACRLLEAENGVPKVAFGTGEVQIRIADRLGAPNTDDTLRRVEPQIREALAGAFGKSTIKLERIGAPRDLFTVAALLQ